MGPPQDLYERPASPFVAEFFGTVNVFRGRSRGGVAVLDNGAVVPHSSTSVDGPVSVYVRPHDLDVDRHRNGHPGWPGKVRRLVPLGGHVRLEVALPDGSDVLVQLGRDRHAELALAPGDDVFVSPRAMKVFDVVESPAPDYHI